MITVEQQALMQIGNIFLASYPRHRSSIRSKNLSNLILQATNSMSEQDGRYLLKPVGLKEAPRLPQG